METVSLDTVYNLLQQINHKLDEIELDINELKHEKGLEVRPEYVEKLKRISEEETISQEEFEKRFGVKI